MTVPHRLRTEIEDGVEQLVERTLELLSYDTQNPPGGTASLLEAIETEFQSLGLHTERIVADPAKPNLLATLPGESDRTLCLNGHLDTVPYDETDWVHDPLGERDGDRIYGRGATDMKGPLAAMLAVARVYEATDTTPPVTLQWAIVSDEEIAGDPGLPAVIESERLDADWCVIGETTCEAGRHSVTVADKGSVWLTLEAEGDAAHGSRPMLGENAIDRLYGAVQTIRERFGTEQFDLDPAVEAIVAESVDYYAPRLGDDAARELFTHPTINLGTIEGGDAINTVPVSATARVDVRLTAGVQTRDVIEQLRACASDCEGIHIADVSWSVGTYEPLDSPLVAAVSDLAGEVTGDRIYRRSATGGGDAKKLRNAGIPTVDFGLGTDTVHAVDEYTTVDALTGNALVYASLPYRLAEI